MIDALGNEPPDFAVIGHQESWENIQNFINGIRSAEKRPLEIQEIKETFGYIPPRSICKMRVKSKTGAEIRGIYIDAFIEPDKLDLKNLRINISKVSDAIKTAQKLEARIIALGGFTSIVLEGNLEKFDTSKYKITTGNTLTTAYIIKGIEKAASQANIRFKDCNILIIGATGDIGMACSRYLKNKVKKLLLCARNRRRLEEFSAEISEGFEQVKFSNALEDLITEADIIISAASSNDIEITKVKSPVIICDAGYPKNLEKNIADHKGVSLFHGGMGQVLFGYDFIPDYTKFFYDYPAPHIGHGCILEAVILAFENKYENYSSGKGNIQKISIDSIYELSIKHGIELAPFYNSKGLWA
ncbi:MAG: hypothetical protein R3213_06845 [Flavobacteriaceae bacterium]|nr:hypothetical protein [Flavobacteriaceae bacterium]